MRNRIRVIRILLFKCRVNLQRRFMVSAFKYHALVFESNLLTCRAVWLFSCRAPRHLVLDGIDCSTLESYSVDSATMTMHKFYNVLNFVTQVYFFVCCRSLHSSREADSCFIFVPSLCVLAVTLLYSFNCLHSL